MAEEPKVCVLMATYNGANYLAEQLESIAGQTHKNITLLVSDDGSTDETLAILEEYKKKIDIKVVNNTLWQCVKGDGVMSINKRDIVVRYKGNVSPVKALRIPETSKFKKWWM